MLDMKAIIWLENYLQVSDPRDHRPPDVEQPDVC